MDLVLPPEENAEIYSVLRGQPSSWGRQMSQPEVKRSLYWPAKRKSNVVCAN
jgi:hypothetical protein